MLMKKSGPIFKELKNSLPKKLSLSSHNYMGLGSGIRDPEKTYSGSRIQGSKRHRIPNPGSTTLSRGTYLGGSCGNDQVELLEEVRSLLAALLLVSHHLHLVSSN